MITKDEVQKFLVQFHQKLKVFGIIYRDDRGKNQKTLEELQDNKELQNMGRYEYQEVMLNGKKVIACTTNQQYEDIIWGGAQEILEELDDYYGTDIQSGDLATEIRDFILARLEDSYDMKFVDVFDEY